MAMLHMACKARTILTISGLILGLQPANVGRRYKVMPSRIDWVMT